MPSLDISGVPHDYNLTTARPNAATIVFVHGWMLSRHYWEPLVDRLSHRYQCLTYDLRGFGGSQPCRGDRSYGLQSYAEDLQALIQTLGLAHVWLVGHSLGGSIALWAAELMPQQVQGVICVNAGGGIYLKEEFERFRSAGRQIVKFRSPWLAHMPGLDWLFARANVAQPLARRWGKQRLVDFVTADAQAALGSLLESTVEEEVHRLPQLVARLQQPVYFVAGREDTLMEPQYVHHLASFHPLFRDSAHNVTELPSCGHLAMLEQTDLLANHVQMLVGELAYV